MASSYYPGPMLQAVDVLGKLVGVLEVELTQMYDSQIAVSIYTLFLPPDDAHMDFIRLPSLELPPKQSVGMKTVFDKKWTSLVLTMEYIWLKYAKRVA